MATRFAVSAITRDFSPLAESGKRMDTSGWERVCLDERRHAVVLVLPFTRALGLAAVGIGLMAIGWPASIAGVALQVIGAAVAVRAVWSWEQTRVVLTTEKLFVVHGTLRKRAAAVRLARLGAVEIAQGLLGRLLGYGTIVAGDLEIEYVPEPRRIYGLVERLSA
jgi:membrane protein YdbS with pleckstrin-like domain